MPVFKKHENAIDVDPPKLYPKKFLVLTTIGQYPPLFPRSVEIAHKIFCRNCTQNFFTNTMGQAMGGVLSWVEPFPPYIELLKTEQNWCCGESGESYVRIQGVNALTPSGLCSRKIGLALYIDTSHAA